MRLLRFLFSYIKFKSIVFVLLNKLDYKNRLLEIQCAGAMLVGQSFEAERPRTGG